MNANVAYYTVLAKVTERWKITNKIMTNAVPNANIHPHITETAQVFFVMKESYLAAIARGSFQTPLEWGEEYYFERWSL